MMNREMIAKTEAFLKDTFAKDLYFQDNPTQRNRRLEHSYRVANIAKQIAEAEGLHVTYAVIGGLLHDIDRSDEVWALDEWREHGRFSAFMARPFLESLGLPADAVNEICYGIAIQVDGKADFEWECTPLCKTVRDADMIDRYDACEIYEILECYKFSKMRLDAKREMVASTIERLTQLKGTKLGTATAQKLWLQRLDFYIGFYEKLKAQLENSDTIR